MDDELERAHRLSKDDLEAKLAAGRPAEVGTVRIIGAIRLELGKGVRIADPQSPSTFVDSRVEMDPRVEQPGVRVG